MVDSGEIGVIWNQHGTIRPQPDTPATLQPMSADAPKSAFELAMQRLRQKDKEANVDERPLTDAQKAAIAEVRQVFTAKTAEREILHRAALRKAATREEGELLNENRSPASPDTQAPESLRCGPIHEPA